MEDAQLNVNLFDAIVFGVLFLCCMLSFFRGFIREVISLLAWVGAAMITLYFVMDVKELIAPYIQKEVVAAIFAALGTYFVALTLISIVTSIMLKYIKQGADVGSLDNILGLVFGFIKGSVVILLGFFLMSMVMNEEDYPEWMKSSISLPYVKKGAETMEKMMPGYLQDLISEAEKAKQQGQPIDPNAPQTAPADSSSPGYENNSMQELNKILNDSVTKENP